MSVKIVRSCTQVKLENTGERLPDPPKQDIENGAYIQLPVQDPENPGNSSTPSTTNIPEAAEGKNQEDNSGPILSFGSFNNGFEEIELNSLHGDTTIETDLKVAEESV